jgi:hypothetical protein
MGVHSKNIKTLYMALTIMSIATLLEMQVLPGKMIVWLESVLVKTKLSDESPNYINNNL